MTSLLKDLKTVKQSIKNWWLFVILGIFLIIGGIYVMTVPVDSYVALSILFSVMIFVNGIFDVAFSISNREVINGWGWYLAGGILEILLGVVLMYYPGISMIALPLVLGFWLMYGAVSTISGAFDLKSYYIKGWGWVLALGIVLMIFSFMVLADPIFGTGAVVIFTSLAIISYGVSYVMIGLKLKKVKRFAGDIKTAVLSNIDNLKNEILTSVKEATDNQTSSQDIGKKFDSFKDSLSE